VTCIGCVYEFGGIGVAEEDHECERGREPAPPAVFDVHSGPTNTASTGATAANLVVLK
jgi:hypothetical protein